MSENNDHKVIRLEKDNYVLWNWQIQNIFNVKGLGDFLKIPNPGETIPLDRVKDSRALALLGSSLSSNEMYKVINCTTFKEAWETIEKNHGKKRLINLKVCS